LLLASLAAGRARLILHSSPATEVAGYYQSPLSGLAKTHMCQHQADVGHRRFHNLFRRAPSLRSVPRRSAVALFGTTKVVP